MMKKKAEIKLTTNALIGALFIIRGIVGTIYYEYPYSMWSWVGLGAGIFLGDYIAYKKFGFRNVLDDLLDFGFFVALVFGFYLFILAPILIIGSYISPTTIETIMETIMVISPATMGTIMAIFYLIIGAITFPTVRYFRTRKQKTDGLIDSGIRSALNIEKKAEIKLTDVLIDSGIRSALVIIGCIVGIIYFNYPLWSWVGLGAGIFLGDYIAYKKFGFRNDYLDPFSNIGLFMILGIGLSLFIQMPILIIYPYISSIAIETINAIFFLIIGAIYPTIQYFRTKKQKTN